jgi:hypothetical protein
MHLSGVRALFEITAAHPNEVVTFTALLTHSGLDAQQQRNEHARISRISAKMFGVKKWPIEYWQSSTLNEAGKAEMLYRMGGTVAEWYRAVSH